MPDLLVIPGFLEPAECEAARACFGRVAAAGRLIANPAGDPYWDHRFIWLSALPPGEQPVRALMHRARRHTITRLRQHFAEPAPLYSDGVQLVRWPPGIAMPPHADNANPDGSPHGTPHRDYAAVIYLNDDFEGGELYFPNSGETIRPRTGLLAAFTGGMEHFHGVHAARGGVRYTMPAWYTRDETRRDPCELEWDEPA